MDDAPELRRWIARAFEAAASLPQKAAKAAAKSSRPAPAKKTAAKKATAKKAAPKAKTPAKAKRGRPISG